MESKDHYISIEENLKKINKEDVKILNMPIAIYLQEAEDLYHVAKEDADKLAQAGLTAEMIEELNTRVGACRYAQSVWNKELNEIQEASRMWKEKSPEAFDLRDQLVHTFYFAFRKDEELTEQVRSIDEGGSNADMIQDLSDLSLLGEKHLEALKTLGINEATLNKASALTDEMADLLAAANGERYKENENKLNRDKAYTYLKEMVDEIRETGKYIFWKDEEKLGQYLSKFLRRKRMRLERKKADQEDNLF